MTPEEISVNENFWYPLYLLLIGGGMAAIGVPIVNKLHETKQIKIAREREDHQKELEIKSEIIKKISAISIQVLIKLYYLADKEIKIKSKDISALGTEEYMKWYTEREITSSLLTAYFRDSELTKKWKKYVHTLAQLMSLFDVGLTGLKCSDHDFKQIKEYFQDKIKLDWDEIRKGSELITAYNELNFLLTEKKENLIQMVLDEKINISRVNKLQTKQERWVDSRGQVY